MTGNASSNRFYGPLSKLYEGPLNDIRQKVVEEGWYGRPVTGDLQGVTPEAKPLVEPVMDAPPAGSTVVDAKFVELYGEPLTPIEAQQIEAPTVEPPRIEGPRIDP